MKIAVDIGYGFTKVKTENKEFKFPTAVSYAKQSLSYDDKDFFSFNGSKFIVGTNEALLNALPTTDYDFLYNYAPLLIVKALQLANIQDIEFELHTGLSLYDMQKPAIFETDCANRKEEFIKRLSSFVVNDTHYTPKVTMFAQGQGAWFEFCKEFGFIENGIDVIVDIGYRTNDIIIFDSKIPLKNISGADDKGVNVIVNDLKTYLSKKYDTAFTQQEVVEILKEKEISIYGKSQDLTIIIDNIVSDFINSLIASLKANYGSYLKKAQRVIIAGGGAYILSDYKNKFPPNVVFSKNKDYEFLNVKGYYKG
jgi:plasmid segregation protein ParM